MYLRQTVHSGGGGENDVLAAMFAHDFKHDQCTSDIVMIIFKGLSNTFTNSLKTSEMDDTVNLCGAKNLLQAVTVQEISLDKRNWFSYNGLHTLQAYCMD